MAVSLALVTAVAWGINEWVVARAAKGIPVVVLGVWMSVLGLLVMLPPALALGGAPSLDLASVSSILVPGLLAAGSGFVYWMALRVGKLAIVSPTVATSGGIAALLAVLVLGERFGALGLGALAGAVLGVVLASYGGNRSTAAGIWLAAVAAVGFGAYTFALALAADRIGPAWAVIGYRVAGIGLFVPILVVKRLNWRLIRAQANLVVTATLLETVGFVTLVVAFTVGSVAVVSVIMAQFATVAVLLAATVLRESLRPHQWFGVAFVILSTSTLAAIQ